MKVVLFILDGCPDKAFRAANTPNIDKLADKGILIDDFRAIFPSMTGPTQGTILTGAYPERTGVVGHFYWDKEKRRLVDINANKYCQAETIFKTLKEAGKVSMSIAPRITWDNAIADTKTRLVRYLTESIASSQRIMTNPALFRVLKKMRHDRRFTGMAKGKFGKFMEALKKGKEDFYYIDLNETDIGGHAHGPFSQGNYRAVEYCDQRVGETIDVLESMGGEYAVIVTSDHGMTPVEKKIPLDKLSLEPLGYRLDSMSEHPMGKEINIVKYNMGEDNEAIVVFVTRYGQIWLKKPEDAPKIINHLKKIKELSHVFSKDESEEYRLKNDRTGEVIFALDYGLGFDVNPWKGDHGGLQESDLRVPFILGGNCIERGRLKSASVVDIAPTLSTIFGIRNPSQSQGRSLVAKKGKGFALSKE